MLVPPYSMLRPQETRRRIINLATMSAPQATPFNSAPEGTGTNTARHRVWLNEIEDLLSRSSADDDVGINPARALRWILEKYDSASLSLPPRVEIYMQTLLQHLRPQIGAENPDFHRNKEIQTLASMHIHSAFLITEADEMQPGNHSAHPGFRLNDFNGRQAYVPLVLCRSWTDLSSFLNIILEGDRGSHFITSQNFGLRVPNRGDLLSRETWDSWISLFHEDPKESDVVLNLYAVLRDDTDTCPHCMIQNPVTHPLPDSDQQCIECGFLLLFQDEEVSLTRSTLVTSVLLPGTTDSGPLDAPETQAPIVSEDATEPAQVINMHLSEGTPGPRFSYPPVTPAIQASGQSVPSHVQVIRRRKPFQNDAVDEQTDLISTAHNSATTVTQTPANYSLEVIYKLYMLVLLGLPYYYSRDAPSILGRINDGTQSLYARWVNQWIKIGGAAFLLILFITQRSSASYDLLPRIMLLLSIVLLFFAAIYSIVLSQTFGNLKINTERLDWIRVPHPPKNRFWTPWIMVSLPAMCILWGPILFILSFVSNTHGKDDDSTSPPKKDYSPQTAAALMFVLGLVYLRLMLHEAVRMGSNSGRQPTVPETPLREILNGVLHDVGCAVQIIFGQYNISGGVGGAGGSAHGGASGGSGNQYIRELAQKPRAEAKAEGREKLSWWKGMEEPI
ncbi:hypothetical protein K438DRAFT_1941781 [Mycena galopus ATCC 62051]|nr:hypothetical protein K438DRAFT_1941781 [Mycena galopus ATCC 62051]